MSNTLKFGNGQWGTKVGSALAYNDLDGNFKPLPFDFTRSTSATRINKDGLIEVVTNNKPRIDFKDDAKGALLLEPSRLQLIQYSEDFSQGYWGEVNTTFTDNETTSPSGLLTGKLTRNVTTFSCIRDVTISTTLGSTYVFSAFYKKDTETTINHSVLNENTGYVTFNFDTETISITRNDYGNTIETDGFGFEKYENGWYRVYLKFVRKAGLIQLQVARQDGGVIGQSTFIYGSQLEQGSYPTSYIPTQGSAVTRVADACNNGNLNVDYSGDYTLYLEHETLSLTEYNQFQFRQETSISYIFRVGNSISVGSGIYSATNTIGFNKFALSVTSIGSYKFYKNGVLLSSGSGLNANLETLKSAALGMNIKEIKLYNNALTDQELINLTTI